jgi:biopolymer transport protein ExbB
MPTIQLDSLYDIVFSGGPLMIPIALCSVVALTYMVERSIRLQRSRLGDPGFRSRLVEAVQTGGATAGLGVCNENANAQARVMSVGLRHAHDDWQRREKAVEDAGAREVDRLSANLRPLVVVAMIAPLLGLLGTVWGMIMAFSTIALEDGLGKPEMLAGGISQALNTTAAGLAIAIPTQAAYYYLRGRIDRFSRQAEELYTKLVARLEARGRAPVRTPGASPAPLAAPLLGPGLEG